MAEATVKISIEAVLHDTMAEIAQLLSAEYGVQVLGVSFEWTDVSTVDTRKCVVTSVRIDSRSKVEM